MRGEIRVVPGRAGESDETTDRRGILEHGNAVDVHAPPRVFEEIDEAA
jgi:hypothetical protein